MTSDGTGRISSGADTSRFTVRRLRSAFFLWRTSLRTTDILIASVFVALSLGIGAYVFARARAEAHLAFAQRAQRLEARVSEKLSSALENLYTLQSFVEASSVTRLQFRLLAYPMLARNREVYSFEWLPVVHEAERKAYEAEARAAHLTGYQFWQKGPDGRRVPAGSRASYVPIHYMEPPSAFALGFDIASDEVRWATAGLARDRGEIVASPPFGLVEDEARHAITAPVVAAYAPVFRDGDPGSQEARIATLKGFTIAIFRVAPLVDKAASEVDASGLALSLRDMESPKSPPLAERPQNVRALPRRDGFELPFPVPFAGRQWRLDVFALPDAFLPPRRGAIEAAAAGMLASLIGLVTLTSLRTIARLRRQAEKVGPYRLIARLGKGAMGVVWEARHALLRRPTAVKLLAPGVEGERAVARFEREVQLTAGLTHPSTIAIYDYGRTADGVFYYAMELLHGINLGQLVAFDGPLPPRRVVHLLRQACGALTEAHAAGLIHRDIKPQNLMLCVYGGIPDFLKVLDFGLVKEIGDVEHAAEGEPGGHDAALSQDGSLLGTPLYMAPEGMSDPTKVDARTDLFALGAVGYFLLTGNSPFPGRTALDVFRLERQGPPPPLSAAAPNPVPEALERTLHRCLSFERGERPGSAEELDAMLEACAVVPPWSPADARVWWRERGSGALAMAAAEHEEHEERGQFLMLSSDYRGRG